jgi:AGZA family xanthine/uracil permease-like MFS transporter
VFATGPSLAVNGIGTLAAGLFGSCFPTTIYIGHPGWKALGARAGYSTLNGLVISAICLTGTVIAISKAVPIEAGVAIVLWIGIIITAQAFQATPLRHAPAVAIGLFPAIAAWGATIVAGAFIAAAPPAISAQIPTSGEATTAQIHRWNRAEQARPEPVLTMQDLLQSDRPGAGPQSTVNGFHLHGLNILERGYILTCMILGAVAAFLIDRRFLAAAGWCAAAAALTVLGLMHAYQLSGNTVDYLPLLVKPAAGAFHYRAFNIAAAYALLAILFAMIARRHRNERPGQRTIEAARAAPVLQPVNEPADDEGPIPME